ncbi:MAG TPA: WYL domain-containing protein [Sporichthyaceae bacterium]
MSARRTERLLNLTICLLATRRYLTKDQIRRAVPGYVECATDEAFERMFERDKEELRELGIPLDTGTLDRLHGDELGYRIDREAYALPDVSFAPDELAVLGLAARAWQQASLSTAAGTALLKLKAAGADPDSSGLLGLEPRLSAGEPAFAALWAAVRERRVVRFDYRAGQDVTVATRRVEPWGLLTRNGAWYLVGFDSDRNAPRVFRVGRITGDVHGEGQPGAVVVPPGTDIRDQLARMIPPEPRSTAAVQVREGAGLGLRRTASAARPAEPGWDHLELGYWDIDRMAGDLVAHGDAVVVLAPEELRSAVIERLRVLAGATS